MDDIMLASVETAAFFGGGSHTIISYFDYAEEGVLHERPTCIFPRAQVPEA